VLSVESSAWPNGSVRLQFLTRCTAFAFGPSPGRGQAMPTASSGGFALVVYKLEGDLIWPFKQDSLFTSLAEKVVTRAISVI
jgi:hypothetical protein